MEGFDLFVFGVQVEAQHVVLHPPDRNLDALSYQAKLLSVNVQQRSSRQSFLAPTWRSNPRLEIRRNSREYIGKKLVRSS